MPTTELYGHCNLRDESAQHQFRIKLFIHLQKEADGAIQVHACNHKPNLNSHCAQA